MYVLEKSFLWVLQASLVASVAAVLISLILNLFNDYIEIKFRNVLWIIVIIRLVIPIVPQSHLSLFNIISPKYHNTSIAQSDFFRQG